jgi:hypothetical protein
MESEINGTRLMICNYAGDVPYELRRSQWQYRMTMSRMPDVAASQRFPEYVQVYRIDVA